MKILVVGISVRAMAASAVRSGYQVLALDAFGDQDLKSMTEAYSLHHDFGLRYSPGALCRAGRRLSYDAVAYTSNLENHCGILARIAGDRKIIGNSPKAVEAVRAWRDLFPRLRTAGFRIPETILAGESREADPEKRWLIKPVSGGGGRGISFFKKPGRPDGRFMLQEYLPGIPCSASFIANGRECVVLGVTAQLVGMRPFGSKEFCYCGNILPLPEMKDPAFTVILLDQIRRLASFLTREYGLTGANGIDFILSGQEVCLTEINPRYSASMELIERAYGVPIFHLHAQAALNGSLPEFLLENVLQGCRFLGKAILFAERNAVAPDTKGWLDSGAGDVPAPGERLRRGDPVCTVFASRRTYEETLAGLIERAAVLKEELYA